LSEDVWLEIASKLPYCHGTSSKFVAPIRKYGLLPRKTDGTRPSVYEKELESRKHDAVYVSTYTDNIPSFCGQAADNAVKAVGGEPRVLDVKLDKEDLKRFERDEDSWSEDYRGLFKNACEFSRETGMTAACYDNLVKNVIGDAIKTGKLSLQDACNPPRWFAEITCFGRFAIKDGIPREKIGAVRERVVRDHRYEWEPVKK